MKRAYKVNLSGVLFNIDSDAYEELKNYLDALENYYANDNDGKDIVADIENRMAELLQDRLSGYKKSISKADINEVISILGHPDEISSEDQMHVKNKTYRQIYRNPDDRILGGVCGGLGSYFGVPSNWVRLAFVLSVFIIGAGTLLYIILWALIPLAKTSTELLEMRGQSITIQNIEKAIRKEYENVKKHWYKRRENGSYF
jgi:phage shock protein PspC (stress-responsive transcriptional regulator)